MRIARLVDEPTIAVEWDRLVAGHPLGSFWHTTAWLAYQRAYRSENVDESFAAIGEGESMLIQPLIVSRGAFGAEFSFSGEPTPMPLATPGWLPGPIGPIAFALATASAARWQEIASRYSVRRRVVARVEGDAECIRARRRIIDLSRDGATLWRGVRKSYRALIHRGEREHAILCSSGHACAARAYERLHQARYDSPRPAATYALQREWIELDRAMVAEAVDARGETVGVALWLLHREIGYYASAAYARPNVAHALVWRSLLALRARGYLRADMGWQGRAASGKERGVEHFKGGFGGADVPVPLETKEFAA